MSFSSPGKGPSPWLACSLAKYWPIDNLIHNGMSSVPVALVHPDGDTIPMKRERERTDFIHRILRAVGADLTGRGLTL